MTTLQDIGILTRATVVRKLNKQPSFTCTPIYDKIIEAVRGKNSGQNTICRVLFHESVLCIERYMINTSKGRLRVTN